MGPYQQAPFRPAPYRAPHLGQVVTAPPIVTAPAVTAPTPVPEGLLWTALAAGASYAGIRLGMEEKGALSIVGWAAGIAAGLAALTGLTGLVAPTVARGLPIRWYYAS